MNRYEVTLVIHNNGSRTYVRTIVLAETMTQANELALAMSGPGGEVVIGPYPLDS